MKLWIHNTKSQWTFIFGPSYGPEEDTKHKNKREAKYRYAISAYILKYQKVPGLPLAHQVAAGEQLGEGNAHQSL